MWSFLQAHKLITIRLKPTRSLLVYCIYQCRENGQSPFYFIRLTIFKFSPSKFLYIAFSTRTLNKQSLLFINRTQRLTTVTANFLGILCNRSLSWIQHKFDVKTRCNKTIDMLRVFNFLGVDPIGVLYRALVRSRIAYGT